MRFSSNVAAFGSIATLYATTTSAMQAFRGGDMANDIRFRWGVPFRDTDASSRHIYFQMDAPDRYAWVGMGCDTGLTDDSIFLMYQDGQGNVTISSRVRNYDALPQSKVRRDIELLNGSGVFDGRIIANVRCGDCDSLNQGNEHGWVSAWSLGEALNSTNPNEPIDIRSGHIEKLLTADHPQFELARAINRIVRREEDADEDEDEDVNSPSSKIRLAHGVIMTTVFVGLYPLGALLMSVLNKWFLHSISQLLAYFLMWCGVALGVIHANQDHFLGHQAHTRLGLIVTILMGLQPILGFLHHRQYNQKGKLMGWVGYIHVWYGRALMILGIVNGGLGLQLASNTGGAWVIAYSVIAVLMLILYAAATVYGYARKRKMKERRITKQLQPTTFEPDPYMGPSDMLMEPWGHWNAPSDHPDTANESQKHLATSYT